ncbi:spore coat associated protein CotJA [Anaerosporomusa subterranea]|uniref:spore coat associated protein CotJA n=1 Tax=Anaerosporomusa subterranea TaxID=1794912 RepID=UPI000AD61E23|nr:spore coat associated protein CotJA [Anaerosporomusa subterranea]
MKKKTDSKWHHDMDEVDEMSMKTMKAKKMMPPEPECDELPCVPEDICEHMVLAHSYVLWQHYTRAFCPEEALMKGTLFPELWGVYPIPE